MPATNNGSNRGLAAPERNHFFYGKLMGVTQFEKEQRYHLHKRSLINRLVLGTGVVCGLDVVFDPDSDGRLRIEPGVAIDGRGCEIVFHEPVSIDPHQLTDLQGEPQGEPIDEGSVELCLAYAECKKDPVPVLVPDCDNPGNCAPSTIRESFRILVRRAGDEIPAAPSCGLGEPTLPDAAALHERLCQRISEPCPVPPDRPSACVLLARVALPLNEDSIDPCAGRPLVYSNALLYELNLCLLEQIRQLAQGRFLRYVSGDAQTAPVGQALGAPLVVEVVDAQGQAIEGVLVQYQIASGEGTVTPATATTGPQGRTETEWTLGPVEGEQTVTASAAGSVFQVSFRAAVRSAP